uniref:Secreted protein n=1 Tax=Plectus sambesii TaxID=2011161 RepID=A0A914V5S5_9BILA
MVGTVCATAPACVCTHKAFYHAVAKMIKPTALFRHTSRPATHSPILPAPHFPRSRIIAAELLARKKRLAELLTGFGAISMRTTKNSAPNAAHSNQVVDQSVAHSRHH